MGPFDKRKTSTKAASTQRLVKIVSLFLENGSDAGNKGVNTRFLQESALGSVC